MTDSITQLYAQYESWIMLLSPTTYSFILRATYLFGIPLLLCRLSYAGENTQYIKQWLCLVGGALLACILPVAEIYSATLRVFLVSVCILLLGFLPAALPAFLVATPLWQVRIRTAAYSILLILLILNCTE